MATVIGKDEAYAHLVEVVDRAMGGEEIVIAQEGRHRLKLVPVDEPAPPRGERPPGTPKGMIKEAPGVSDPMAAEDLHPVRRFGSMRGRFKLADSFFDPLPEEELRAWEGG